MHICVKTVSSYKFRDMCLYILICKCKFELSEKWKPGKFFQKSSWRKIGTAKESGTQNRGCIKIWLCRKVNFSFPIFYVYMNIDFLNIREITNSGYIKSNFCEIEKLPHNQNFHWFFEYSWNHILNNRLKYPNTDFSTFYGNCQLKSTFRTFLPYHVKKHHSTL